MNDEIITLETPEVLADEIETLHTNTEILPSENWKSVKTSLNNYLQMEAMVKKYIDISQTQCIQAETEVRAANNYKTAWYKLGSNRKKCNMVSNALVSIQKHTSSLQNAQAISYELQKELSIYCTVLLQMSRKSDDNYDRISQILEEIIQRDKRNETNSTALEKIKNIYYSIQEDKKTREQDKAKYTSVYSKIFWGITIVLLFIISYILINDIFLNYFVR